MRLRRRDRPESQHLLRAAFTMMRPHRRRMLLALVSVVGALGTTLAGPLLVDVLIDHGLVHHHSRTLRRLSTAYRKS